ncbi:MAG: VacJ family lipoprotein [Uliginosibacterium sp.]|jgi:phospholipid-binding lipoprotein MlaA|nr:VacJ family lipoprotein [Uliginosibacterium sp.]MBK9615478.1 VacJ family lipoprotein [Uliginosibacterium sp.]
MMTTRLCALLIAALLAGCASTGNPKDPLEPLNRKVFAFNDALDTYALQPVAKGYVAATPLPVRSGIGNFFSNLDDVWTGINNLLQGKVGRAGSDVGRLLINSTVGIFGLFDVASELGLEKHDEDLGQTLGVWGVGPGPYLVLPLLGSTTLRDTANFASTYVDPVPRIERVATRNTLRAVKLVDTRAQLLNAGRALDEAAIDKYAFMRDFYLKRRQSQIFDGRPPREEDDEAALPVPFQQTPQRAADLFMAQPVETAALQTDE